MIRRFFLKQYNDLFCHDEWNIGIWHRPIAASLIPDGQPEIRWFPKNKAGHYRADPFGIKRDGRLYVFFEDFDAPRNRGEIVYVTVDEQGAISEETKVMGSPVHMSYPYLVEHEGDIFCIPEAHEVPPVRLYKARRFPNDWIPTATLVENVSASDSTVFHYAGRWWLTYTSHSPDSHSENLCVWYAPDLSGPWRPHKRNPVKRDISSARPAGTPFVSDGTLYRPAQDCSRTYGGRIVINRVTRLTETEFREEWAAAVGPFAGSPYREGAHTLASAGDVTLVDAKRTKTFPGVFRQVLQRKVRGLFGLSRAG